MAQTRARAIRQPARGAGVTSLVDQRGAPRAPAQALGRHVPPWLALGAVLVLAAVAGAGWLFLGGTARGGGAISTLRTADFHALAISPSDANVVLFGHHDGILRSQDGGRNWQPLVARRNFDAMSLAISSTDPRQVYLAGHDILMVSGDGGATWQPLQHNLPGTDIHGFTVSPDDPTRLYAYVVGQGLGRSADGGRTWEGLGARLPDDVHALAAAGGNPEVLYAGSMRQGVLRSTDGGQTWTPGTTGMGVRMVAALAVDPSARQTVYAGADGGLYKSTNAGHSWRKLPLPGDNAVALAVSPSRSNVVLAITSSDKQGLVFRSEDGGTTWR